ncbi:MAG TPA: SdrD B-like domain-containing protein, partial [Emticicia sp.]
MRHIFTTNKREHFARNTSTPINVFRLIKKLGGMVGIYLKKLGKKSIYQTPITTPSNQSFNNEAIENEANLQEKNNFTSQANDFNQLFHVKAKLASDTGATLIQSTTSSKTYHLGSSFDEDTKEWIPNLYHSTVTCKNAFNEDNPPTNSSFLRGAATTILLVLFSVLGAFANKFATVDLSLRSLIDNSSPVVGNSVKYTLWLKNEGATTANSIVVKNMFPVSGVTLTSNTGGSGFTHNTGTGEGLWNVATLAAGDSVKLELVGTVTQRGVYFNIAEINSIGGGDTDSDSTPGNNNLAEDDITTVCFSVPLLIYPSEQYTVFIPSAYKKSGTIVKWFRNGTEIIGTTPEAVVNADTSLTIKAVGSYTFTSNVGGCIGQGCCAIQVIAGPYGSIGDLVWKDKNDNGLKDANEPGIKNIILELYTVDALNNISVSPIKKDTTDDNGHYLFANLLSGDYLVKIAPSNLSDTLRISKKKDIGSDDTKDNDFSAGTGYATKVTINVDSTGNKKDNLTVDAALYTPVGSIGDFVWNDSNNNGIQDGGEAGVNNVILELYAANASGNPVGSAIAKDTTNASGLYKFTNLVKGDYVVKLLISSLPAGSIISTKTKFGSDPKADSDFSNVTALTAKITLDPENTADPLNKDNLTLDAAIYNPLGSIGDYVWKDLDNDGVQDIDETGLGGVILHLYAANTDGSPSGSVLKADTTDTNGFYLFSGLTAGNYVVQIITSSLPASASISEMIDKGGNDSADSDFNSTTAYSPKIIIDPATSDKKDILTIDAAIHQAVSCPTLTVSTIDGDICVGDSTFIKGITSNNASIKWYLSAINGSPAFTSTSNASVLVFPTTTTTYYAEIDGLSLGCPNSRQPVVIVVNARPSLPSCAGVVDECIGKTINLNNYVINGATTPGGTFEWHTTANEKSPLVATPSTVGAGTYYLFEKSGAGCFSPPRMLKVNLKNCDTLIDLSLTKIVSTMTPKVWDNIVYTIKVTNAGPHAATNVEVEDQMPTGLDFISSPFFTKNGNILTSKISNIAPGQTITLDYIVKVNSSGDKINFAQISKADQKDIDSTPGNASTASEDDNSKVIISPVTDEVVADLSLDKTTNKTTATTGELITYYITVLNNGSSNATNVEVKDVVPDGLEIITATGADNITTSGKTVTAKFNEIKVGFALTFQIVTRVTASTGTVKNWAQITKSDQKDGDSTPDNGTTNGEDDTDDADITITPGVCNPPIPLIATSTPYMCTGESVTLTSVGCTGTVVWSTGDTGNSITLSPTSSTTYTAKCKISDACLSSDSNPISIVVNQIVPPIITSNAPNNTICAGGSVILSANSCTGSVVWSNGTTASSITVSPTTNTTYTAICKSNSCTSNASSPLTITIGGSVTAPTVTASKVAICAGETVTLSATGCTGNITWSNGMSGTSVVITPGSTGTYSATCSSSGCGSQTSPVINITVSPAPSTPVITRDKDIVCAGGNVNLTATGCNGTLVWSNGVSSSSLAVSPTTATT